MPKPNPFNPNGAPKKNPPDDLYIMQMFKTGDIKVGRSKDVDRRLDQLQTGCPHPLRVILQISGQGYRERAIHRIMKRHMIRRNGEWFTEGALAELPPEFYGLLNLELSDWWIS